MSNNTFQPTSVTATTSWQSLSSLLVNAGFPDIVGNSLTASTSYLKNINASISLYVGFGPVAPTYYSTVGPYAAQIIEKGMNANLVWIKSASSTVAVDFVEGAAAYVPATVNGVIGEITATTDTVPKADGDGNLVASSISDDGSSVIIGEDVEVVGNASLDGTLTVASTTGVGGKVFPTTNDGAALGDTTHNFSDLFLASGAVVNFNNGNVALTQSSGILTMGTGEMRITSAGTNAASVITQGSTNSITNKTLVSPVVSTGLTASGSASNNFGGSTGAFVTSSGANTITGAATFSDLLTTVTGTTALANINTPAGTLKTTAVAGDLEYDGVNRYTTNNTTSGRSAIYADNYFRLTSTGSTISTIANYFGSNSNPILVSGGYYEIDIYAYFLKSTAGTVVWTFTNSAAPTAQDIYYEMSPITGIVAPPGTATMLVGQIYNDATAAKALSATGTLSDAVNHYMHTKIWLQNSTGTSLQIQATVSAGTITPGIGSRWYCRRLPAANCGLFAA